MTGPNRRPYAKLQLPLAVVSLEELAVLFNYTTAGGVRRVIANGTFPIPTHRHGRKIYAIREVVREYFQKQQDAHMQVIADQETKINAQLVVREKIAAAQARRSRAVETLAQRLAQKEQKRKEAQVRKRLADK